MPLCLCSHVTNINGVDTMRRVMTLMSLEAFKGEMGIIDVSDIKGGSPLKRRARTLTGC